MQNTVPFDPGYSEFSTQIPAEAGLILDQIAQLKQSHKRKFEFQKFEMQIVPLIKRCAAVYIGCILWGSYLFHRYKDDPKEISGNAVMELPPEQRSELDYTKNIDFIIELIDKLNKAGNYYLRRSSKAGESLGVYFKAYKEFCELNDNFKSLQTTDQIKLPSAVAHFQDYDIQKLDALKSEIEEIIVLKKIDRLLQVGFYSAYSDPGK